MRTKEPFPGIVTPHGMKIRLSPKYTFSLMARLLPEITPLRLLEELEYVQAIPYFFCFNFSLVAVIAKVPLHLIPFLCISGYLLGYLLTYYGARIPGLLSCSKVFRKLQRCGVYMIVFFSTLFFLVGWKGLLVFFSFFISVDLIMKFFDGYLSLQMKKKGNEGLFLRPERNFIQTFRYYAWTKKRNLALTLSQEEEKNSHWKKLHEEYKEAIIKVKKGASNES